MPTPTPLPVEPSGELARLRDDLIAFYRPLNSQERLAVERIALAQQSMLRAARLEASLFASAPADAPHTILETEAFKVFLRYQAQAERSYRRAVDELLDLQAQRPPLPVPPETVASAHRPQPVPTTNSPASPPRPAAAPVVSPAAASASHAIAGNLALRL
jgi:hypothetical protein